MTLDRIHEFYETSFFCQVSKWGHQLTEEDANKLGLPLDAPKATRKRKTEVDNKEESAE